MTIQSKVWSNGNMIPFEEAKVHMLSHGFSRGSAIFEVFRVHASSQGPFAFRMDEHLKRLERTCELLGMELSMNISEIKEAVIDIATENRLNTGVIKIMAYYSEISVANLVPDEQLDITIFAIPLDDVPAIGDAKPVSACISKWCKIHPRSMPPMAKACANYLNGFLARQDAKKRGYDIGILLDTHGFVAEASIESVFMVKDNVIKTPPLGRVLSSVSRSSVLELAQKNGYVALETAILPEDMAGADEIFISATPYPVLPVERLEEKRFDVPGPVTLQLEKLMQNVFEFKDNRFDKWFQPLFR